MSVCNASLCACVCVRYAVCCCSWWRSLRKQHTHIHTKTTLGHAQTPNEIRHWTVKTNSNVFDFVACVCVRICINFFNYMFVNGISDLFVNEVTYNEAKQSTKQNEWSCMRGTEPCRRGVVVVVYGELKKSVFLVIVVVVLKVFIGNSKGITCENLK